MAYTTENLVGEIVEIEVGQSVTPFIEVAHELVVENCENADQGYTPTRLEMIERYLAAHFYCISNPRVSQESAGPVSASYQHKVGLGLDLSSYGQMAKTLDTKGGLAALDTKTKLGKITKVARVLWVGRDDSVESDVCL